MRLKPSMKIATDDCGAERNTVVIRTAPLVIVSCPDDHKFKIICLFDHRYFYLHSNNSFEKINIDGLLVFTPKIYLDERGYFFESYNKKEFENNTVFVQDNESKSKYRTLRGIHFQENNNIP